MADAPVSPNLNDAYGKSGSDPTGQTAGKDPLTGQDPVYEESPEIRTPDAGNTTPETQGGIPVREQEHLIPRLPEEKTLPDPLAIPELSTVDEPRLPSGRIRKRGKILPTLLLVIVLLAIGVGISLIIRQFTNDIPSISTFVPGMPGSVTATPSVPAQTASPTPNPDAMEGWRTESVFTGTANVAYPGVTYRLPADILTPICDGALCVSRGTYLPGGTRFTVSFKTETKTADEFLHTVVTDAASNAFDTQEASMAGRPARTYAGSFAGQTTGGYQFTRLAGIMILLPDNRVLEFNHFSPLGLNADFTSDEALFQKIVGTVKIGG